jgi:hypothetical protein
MPGGTTPKSNLPYVLLTDVPDANVLAEGLANALDSVVTPKYPTSGARDAANPTPTAGDAAFVAGLGYTEYDGTGWYTFDTILPPTAYTPAWTTSTGLHSPSIGNGVFACRYSRIGRLVMVHFQVTFGSTTNFGSGATSSDNWEFSLPFAFDSTHFTPHAIGLVAMADSSNAADNTIGQAVIDGTNTFHINPFSPGAGTIDSLTPFTWASADSIEGDLFYYRS